MRRLCGAAEDVDSAATGLAETPPPTQFGKTHMIDFTSARAAYALYRRRRAASRQVYRELGAMTDAELNDIGISRVVIRDLAREAAAQVR